MFRSPYASLEWLEVLIPKFLKKGEQGLFVVCCQFNSHGGVATSSLLSERPQPDKGWNRSFNILRERFK
jgi:hypothetical protein